MSLQDSQSRLLSLPLKVRIQIYRYILVCKPQIRAACKPRGPMVNHGMLSWKPHGQMFTPSILRACKQIYRETFPILYSENTFLVDSPGKVLKWLKEIGPASIKRLARLRLFLCANYCSEPTTWLGAPAESPLWYKLLDQLAQEAIGLQYIYIYWDSELSMGHAGAGRDTRFVRELAKIQGLKEMSIDGFYAKNWPEYLSKKMGVMVKESDDSKSWYLQSLRGYQRGTENLIP